MAARLGDADAQQELAFCLANGKGCKKDRKESAKWYRAAVRSLSSIPFVESLLTGFAISPHSGRARHERCGACVDIQGEVSVRILHVVPIVCLPDLNLPMCSLFCDTDDDRSCLRIHAHLPHPLHAQYPLLC